MDKQCTGCGRIAHRGRWAKGYPRILPSGLTNSLCPQCRREFRALMPTNYRAAARLLYDRWHHNYPQGQRGAHLRRASQPNPFRSRSEPLRRARKAKAQQRRRKRGR